MQQFPSSLPSSSRLRRGYWDGGENGLRSMMTMIVAYAVIATTVTMMMLLRANHNTTKLVLIRIYALNRSNYALFR